MRLPWRMAIGGNAQNYVYADNVCTGYQDDVSTRFYHCVSGNNNIATVTSTGYFTEGGWSTLN